MKLFRSVGRGESRVDCHCRLHEPAKDTLDEYDKALLANVQEFGWHLVMIQDDSRTAGWTFSVGMTHTLGTPELAIFGVRSSSAGNILNAIGDRIREGERPTVGSRLLGVLADERPLAFGAVDESWHRPLFGYARWFAQRPPLRFLQVVLPDADNRFPDDPLAAEVGRQGQPLLAIPASAHPLCDWTGAVLAEQWRLPAWPNKTVYVSRSVTNGESPLLHVIHDRDDDWLFADDASDFRPEAIGLEHLIHVVQRDPGVEGLGDLAMGWEAWRPGPGAPWERRPVGDGEDEAQPHAET